MTTPRDDDARDPIRSAREEARAEHVQPADTGGDARGEQAGDTIGRYKLLQQIGEGGMGTVWMAEQSEPVRRKVALKIIKLGMDTREVIARFEAERQALALMEHPNIARVLDGGATASGRPFFVMELVKGVPITEFCDRAKLELTGRLELFASVCRAIQHAHTKGVVHRDIKPSNVMVTLHDGTPMVKVIDFGIAKATSAELTQKTLFTRYAQIIGTPEYMAPEQAEMSALDVDTRADVYSLGVLLYELLTGTTPFDLREVLERGYAELMRTIREEEPARPSTRVSTLGQTGTGIALSRGVTPDRLEGRLRGDLDRIVMKAISKDRAMRYETAVAFAEDIGRCLRNEPVLAVSPSAGYRLRKFVQRRRKTVLALAVLATSLVLGATGTLYGWLEARDANDKLSLSLVEEAQQRELAVAEAERANRAEADARRDRDRAVDAERAAEQRADELERIATFQEQRLGMVDIAGMGARLRASMLEQVDDEHREQMVALLDRINLSNVGQDALQNEVLAPTLAAIDEVFEESPLVQARLLSAVGHSQQQLGLYEEGLQVGRRALDMFREHAPDRRLRILEQAILVARVASMAQRPEGEVLMRETVETLDRDFPAEPLRAIARLDLATMLAMNGKLGEAVVNYRQAYDVLKRELGPLADVTLSALTGLQQTLSTLGQLADAEVHAREYLAAVCELHGEQAPTTLRAKSCLSHVLMQDRRLEEAEVLAREAATGLARALGDDQLDTLSAVIGLGRVLTLAGKHDEAERLFSQSLERARRVYGEGSRHVRTAINGLALVASNRGDYVESQRLSAELQRMVAELDGDSVNLAAAELVRARSLAGTGENEDALAGFRRARAMAVEAAGTDHIVAIVANQHIARMLLERGDGGEAIRILRALREDAARVFGPEHDHTRVIISELGITLQAQKQFAESGELFEQMVELSRQRGGPESTEALSAEVNLATARIHQDRPEEARELLEHAWNGLKAQLPAGSPIVMQVQVRLVEALAVLQEFDRAAELGQQALVAMRGMFGEKHHETRHADEVMLLLDDARENLPAAIARVQYRIDTEGLPVKWRNDALARRGLLEFRNEDLEACERSLRAWRELPAEDRTDNANFTMSVDNVLAAAMGRRGAFAEAAAMMAESCRTMPTLEWTRNVVVKRDGVALALERGVAFYLAWHAVDPEGGHDAEAAAVQEQLAAWRAGVR